MIEQRIIDDKIYSITILKELTEQDKEDLEEVISKLKESEDSIIQTSKFIVVNTNKTKEEIEEINNTDKIQNIIRVYKENNIQKYVVDNNIIEEVSKLNLTEANKKEIINKIKLIEETIEELEKYLLTLKSKAKEETKWKT